ncbi:MAG: S8 family serine peptidase, partial [Acidobacteriota bacterium]
MNSHRPRSAIWLAVPLAIVLAAAPALARQGQKFDRWNPEGRQLLVQAEDIGAIAERFDLEVLERHETSDGTLWLVATRSPVAAKKLARTLTREGHVKSAAGVALASLPAVTLASVVAEEETSADLALEGKVISPCLALMDSGGVWRGFADQRAAQKTEIHLAQFVDGYWCGFGMTVAVIDTAVDAPHPLLAGAMVAGHDFTRDIGGPGATQTSELGTKTRAIVEGNNLLVQEGEGSIAMLAASAVILGEDDGREDVVAELTTKGPFFGHGTMVAGLIRLSAPAAKIMPLEAFDEEGVGHPFDIVRAVDYAVDNGADIINMSFSISEATPELHEALRRARRRGVMTVAAAGNSGEMSQIFPAGFSETIGVAATDLHDQLTDFSNSGLANAALAAPGSGVVTLYPGGLYATGWGTSFSTPLVTGTLALIRNYYSSYNAPTHDTVRLHLLLGTDYRAHLWDHVLSSGRLDAAGAVIETR